MLVRVYESENMELGYILADLVAYKNDQLIIILLKLDVSQFSCL